MNFVKSELEMRIKFNSIVIRIIVVVVRVIVFGVFLNVSSTRMGFIPIISTVVYSLEKRNLMLISVDASIISHWLLSTRIASIKRPITRWGMTRSESSHSLTWMANRTLIQNDRRRSKRSWSFFESFISKNKISSNPKNPQTKRQKIKPMTTSTTTTTTATYKSDHLYLARQLLNVIFHLVL